MFVMVMSLLALQEATMVHGACLLLGLAYTLNLTNHVHNQWWLITLRGQGQRQSKTMLHS
jgi:TRAP-type mannitol/chloroaromatic compound transport system permease small subunit